MTTPGALTTIVGKGGADAIVSANWLHWIAPEHHPLALREFRLALRPGGCGVALLEMDGQGSMQGFFDAMLRVCAADTRWARRFGLSSPGSCSFDFSQGFARFGSSEYSRLLYAAGLRPNHCALHSQRSVHRDEAAVHARLQGAWTQIPALSALGDEAEARSFLHDVGELFCRENTCKRTGTRSSGDDGDDETGHLLQNNILLVEACT